MHAAPVGSPARAGAQVGGDGLQFAAARRIRLTRGQPLGLGGVAFGKGQHAAKGDRGGIVELSRFPGGLDAPLGNLAQQPLDADRE